MNTHEFYMRRCFQLAKQGLGTTGPNPLVGSVIVHDGRIIGEGFHFEAGLPHAEPNAIKSVSDPGLLTNSTIYVNLEPCSHEGRTPACTTAIKNAGIPNVIVANRDPNPQVSESEKILRSSGVNVTYGILEEEGLELNKRFFTRLQKNRPHIILKWAQTTNGYIDRSRTENDPGIFWITEPQTKSWVHRLRAQEGAILVGAQTAITDNPSLTCRQIDGRNPLRVVIDPNLKVPVTADVFDKNGGVIIVNNKREDVSDNIQYWKVTSGEQLLPTLLSRLAQLEVNSMIVEGGKTTLNHFIQAGLWDEAYVLEGQNLLNKGVKAPAISGEQVSKKEFGLDTIKHLLNR